jgi:hypothetical protein
MEACGLDGLEEGSVGGGWYGMILSRVMKTIAGEV